MPIFETIKKTLTDKARLKLGDELAAVDNDIVEITEEQKSVNRDFRRRLKPLKEKSASFAKQLIEGVLEEKFEVEEIPDDSREMIDIVRVDNGRKMNSRKMNDKEREACYARKQTNLPFEGKKGEEKPVAKEGKAEAAGEKVQHNGQSLTKVKRGAKKAAAAPKASAKKKSKK